MKEEMILRALRMIGERHDYWDEQARRTSSASDCAASIAYGSAFSILEAAISGYSDFLDQLDYYGGE